MNAMNKKPDSLLYILALAGLIVAAVITTSIIGAVKNNQAGTDIRAKAGVTNTLKLTGIVESADDLKGTVKVLNVQFAQESRSGKAVDYGTWIVTPPNTFEFPTAVPGAKISFTVNSDSFDVMKKEVVAAQMAIEK